MDVRKHGIDRLRKRSRVLQKLDRNISYLHYRRMHMDDMARPGKVWRYFGDEEGSIDMREEWK